MVDFANHEVTATVDPDSHWKRLLVGRVVGWPDDVGVQAVFTDIISDLVTLSRF